jgi:Tat protein secretion system quality control protein TatD with DNase activity
MHFHVESQFHEPSQIEATLADIEQHKILAAVNSCDIKGYNESVEICSRSKYMFPGFGILPWYADQFADKLDSLKIPIDEVGMLGEIGVDYKYSPPEAKPHMQKALFEFFLRAAEKHDLIINVHVRGDDTMDDTREIMGGYDLTRVIMHSYYDHPEGMRELVDRGYYFTIGQALLSPGEWEDRIHSAIREMPDDLLLAETDCVPREFVAPSVTLTNLHERLAEFRGVSVPQLQDTVHQNTLRLLKGVSQLEEYVKLLE